MSSTSSHSICFTTSRSPPPSPLLFLFRFSIYPQFLHFLYRVALQPECGTGESFIYLPPKPRRMAPLPPQLSHTRISHCPPLTTCSPCTSPTLCSPQPDALSTTVTREMDCNKAKCYSRDLVVFCILSSHCFILVINITFCYYRSRIEHSQENRLIYHQFHVLALFASRTFLK